jgi:hypothetical protein
MALAATNLPAFLRAWSGYFMAMMEAPEPALKALGLPKSLWVQTSSIHSQAIAPYLAWADPELPSKNPDSHLDRLDAEGVRALLGR